MAFFSLQNEIARTNEISAIIKSVHMIKIDLNFTEG